jgi:hypothetical protein
MKKTILKKVLQQRWIVYQGDSFTMSLQQNIQKSSFTIDAASSDAFFISAPG